MYKWKYYCAPQATDKHLNYVSVPAEKFFQASYQEKLIIIILSFVLNVLIHFCVDHSSITTYILIIITVIKIIQIIIIIVSCHVWDGYGRSVTFEAWVGPRISPCVMCGEWQWQWDRVYPVNIIPLMPHPHWFMYHRHYKILITNSRFITLISVKVKPATTAAYLCGHGSISIRSLDDVTSENHKHYLICWIY